MAKVKKAKKDANKIITKRLKEDLAHYRQTLQYLEANVPIECLCLPSEIETLLIADGIVRIYDVFNRNLREIKGLGRKRIGILTSRLDEFFSVSI